MKKNVLGLVLIGLLALGCEAPDPAGEGASVVEPDDTEPGQDTDTAEGDDQAATETPDAAPEPEDEAIVGTRENPVPPGTTFVVGDWEVTVGETNLDATDIVMAENEFNELTEGRQPLMVEVSATYTGEASGNAFDLSWAYVGSAGNTFGGSNMEDFCGVIPNDFTDAGETFPGANVTGNVCYQVPSDQVEGGAWIVESTFSFDGGDRTFVSTN